MNPVAIGPNSQKMVAAHSKLKWLVVIENYEIETAAFWKAPKEYGGPPPAEIQTEVFQLPASGFAEKDGSFTNSARWVEWKWKAVDPPGQAKTDQEILARIFLAVRELYRKEGGAFPEPILNLSWDYTHPTAPDLAEVLKEINGKAIEDVFEPSTDPKQPKKLLVAAGKQLESFGQLRDDGSTACGLLALHRRLHRGREQRPAPEQRRPHRSGDVPPVDMELAGEPAHHVQPRLGGSEREAVGSRRGRGSSGTASNGWVTSPISRPDSPPGKFGPFIMLPEGVGRLFAASLADGPFPEHYEAVEAPVPNLAAPEGDQQSGRPGGSAPTRTSTGPPRTTRWSAAPTG